MEIEKVKAPLITDKDLEKSIKSLQQEINAVSLDICVQFPIPDYINDGKMKINQLKIYPNPFNDKTIIEFNNPKHEKYDMVIRDLAGKIVETIYSITNEKIEITSDKFVEGYYIIELRGEKLYRGKLMVE